MNATAPMSSDPHPTRESESKNEPMASKNEPIEDWTSTPAKTTCAHRSARCCRYPVHMSAIAALPTRPARILPLSRLGDESLAARAANGESAAYSELCERYHAPLLGYCRSILLNDDDANDATQAAL